MEPVHQALKLRNDHVLVVARIADDRAARIVDIFRKPGGGLASRQIARVRIAARAGQGPSEDKLIVRMIEIGRIVRSLAVKVVKIEARCAKVDETVRDRPAAASCSPDRTSDRDR